jgi:SPOR domain
MGNLKFKDFRAARIWLVFAYIWAFTMPATDTHAADGSATPATPVQATSSSTSVQNIQRLLTLLSERYPTKYNAVNPGQVDGSLGLSTRNAIRKFQEISNTKPGSQSNDQLVADILSALALMASQQPEEGGNAVKAQAPVQKATAPESAGKIAKTAETVPPATESPAPRTATTVPAARFTAPPPPARKVAAETAQVEQSKPSPVPSPRAGDRIYFVQAASLRSLANARREWQHIFSNNRIALTGEQIFIEEADIAGRGTYYRILIGPMNERSAAQTLCDYLKKNEQKCVVTERSPGDLQKLKIQESARAPAAVPGTGGGNAGDKAQTTADTSATDGPGKEARAPPGATPQPAPVPIAEIPAAPVAAERTPKEPTEPKTAGPAGTPPGQMPESEASPQGSGPAGAPAEPNTRATAAAGASPPPAPVESPKAERASPAAPAPAVRATDAPATAGGNIPAAPKSIAGTASQASTQLPAQASPEATSGSAATGPAIESAAAADRIAPTSRQSLGPGSTIAELLTIAPGTIQPIGIAIVFVLGATLLVFFWRHRSRRTALAQFVRPADFQFARPVVAASSPPDVMTALEDDFESETLRRSRDDRDAFLRDILGEDVEANGAAPKEDYAIRINSSLKQLLASDPALYKSIFLNLIFLSKVGAALNRNEITIEHVNGHFTREFRLLQYYFKIHILELDDRHRIRTELPGLFYCLQLAQQRQRSGQHRAAT